MNFQRKSATWCIPDETEVEVEELTFSEVIEITGITPVDSVQRKRQIRREFYRSIRGDYDEMYAEQDFA
jgi:hypothetical protein